MAKRFAIAFFVVIGVVIMLLAGFMLLLFLAPGFSVFGLRYIAQNTHVVNIKEERLVDMQGIGNSFSGSIKIVTKEIPVEIRFIPTYQNRDGISVYYMDNYNGLTTSNIEDPTIEIKKDETGAIVITTTEFEKFIFETSSSNRLLRVSIPSAYIASSSNTPNLTIDAGSASIKFYDQESGEERIPSFNNVVLKTTGDITFGRTIKVNNYTAETLNSIEIPSSGNFVDANSYDLTSTAGNITVKRDVPADLTATTNRGDISFVSCKNLIASTIDGDVRGVDDVPEIRGLVKITTRSGNVQLGRIQGSGENVISTGSGNVKISSVSEATITTTRGGVTITSINKAKIKTNIGKVKIEEILTDCDIETKRGNIYLGGEGMTINNPNVFSRLGKIFIYSAVGKSNVQTISSNIYFANKNANDTTSEATIICGGKLTGRNLSGKLNITSSKDIDLEFDTINADVNIELADTARQAKIVAVKNTTLDTRFYLKGANVIRYEKSGNGMFSKVKEGNEISSDSSITGALLKVNGKNALIEVYFNSTI